MTSESRVERLNVSLRGSPFHVSDDERSASAVVVLLNACERIASRHEQIMESLSRGSANVEAITAARLVYESNALEGVAPVLGNPWRVRRVRLVLSDGASPAQEGRAVQPVLLDPAP